MYIYNASAPFQLLLQFCSSSSRPEAVRFPSVVSLYTAPLKAGAGSARRCREMECNSKEETSGGWAADEALHAGSDYLIFHITHANQSCIYHHTLFIEFIVHSANAHVFLEHIESYIFE